MNDLAFLQEFIQEPEVAAAESKGAAEDFLSKPIDGSPVSITAPKGLITESPKAQDVNKSIGQTAKESLVPKVRKIADTKEKAGKILGAAVPDISEAPVPSGGIGLLLFLALLVVFAITPVNGTTGASRLSLLWGTILGNYSISGNRPAPSSKGSKSSTPALPSAGGGMDALIQGGLYT